MYVCESTEMPRPNRTRAMLCHTVCCSVHGLMSLFLAHIIIARSTVFKWLLPGRAILWRNPPKIIEFFMRHHLYDARLPIDPWTTLKLSAEAERHPNPSPFISGWNTFSNAKLFNGWSKNERAHTQRKKKIRPKSFNFHNNFFLLCSSLLHCNFFCSVMLKIRFLVRMKKTSTFSRYTFHKFNNNNHRKKNILNKHLICASQCNNNEKNGDELKTGSNFFFRSFCLDHFRIKPDKNSIWKWEQCGTNAEKESCVCVCVWNIIYVGLLHT